MKKAVSNTNSKKFRILLIYANKMMENLIPVNISLLSAILKENGFDVKLFDTTYYRTEEENGDEVRVKNLQLRDFDLSKYGITYKETDLHEDFRKAVKEYAPDIIGLNIVEDTCKLGISLIDKIRDLKIPVIVGGVHAMISPDEVIAEESVDMVCIGEGENCFAELCKKMHSGQDYFSVKGIWFKKDGKVIKNPHEKLTDITKLPYHDFAVYQKERFYRPMQGKVYKMLPIEISRGCPFSCTYCAASTLKEIYKNEGAYLRRKPIDRIIDEIKHYRDTYGMDYVYFTAETFLSWSDAYFSKFVSLYKEIKLPFWCQTRPETIREDRIKMLEDVNCDRITVGIESGNERIRRELLNRQLSNETIIKAFDILSRSSIPISVNNIIGLPDETREEIFDTIALNRAIKADSISVFIFTPYRGTKLREYCVRKKYIEPDAFSADVRKRSILNMPTISGEEIRGLIRTFPLYVKFPKKDYHLIEKAEKFDEEGEEIFRQLSVRYREKYFR